MDHIEPTLNATERFGAIRELLSRLVRAGALQRMTEPALFNAFKRREKVMSTGIGFGFAVPHVFSGIVSERVVAFGRSPTGVEFDSLDSTPVEFIFLFIFPSESSISDEQIKYIGRVCHHLNPRHTPKALHYASTAQEIKEVLDRILDL